MFKQKGEHLGLLFSIRQTQWIDISLCPMTRKSSPNSMDDMDEYIFLPVYQSIFYRLNPTPFWKVVMLNHDYRLWCLGSGISKHLLTSHGWGFQDVSPAFIMCYLNHWSLGKAISKSPSNRDGPPRTFWYFVEINRKLGVGMKHTYHVYRRFDSEEM